MAAPPRLGKRLEDIAPSLARRLGVPLPDIDGQQVAWLSSG
jgi:hypothetical protein